MRYLVTLIGGVLLGALAALTISSLLHPRDPWPRALMGVMQHSLGAVRGEVNAGRCDDPAIDEASKRLVLMAADIEPALLPPDAHDRVFTQYANDLRTKIAAFDAARGCPARRTAVTDLANACEACHRDYK
jgi:hypothetical protein